MAGAAEFARMYLACVRVHARARARALPPVGNCRSDMQIAAVTTNARLTVTLLTDRYTENVRARGCVRATHSRGEYGKRDGYARRSRDVREKFLEEKRGNFIGKAMSKGRLG